MENADAKVLRLAGSELRCIAGLPLGLLFDLAEATQSGNEMAQLAAFAKTVKAIVVKEDQKRLEAILYDTVNPLTFDELNEALGTVLTQYGKRPFAQPSPSQRGGGTTGGSSKVVSLSRGTAREAETSSRDGERAAS